MTYAHDAHCNTIHEAGPDPCPPAREGRNVWRCECHPNAQWGYFADYPECPISDLYVGDPTSATYATSYRSLAELQAAHLGVRQVWVP